MPRAAPYIIDAVRVAQAALGAGVRAGWRPPPPASGASGASCFNATGATLPAQYAWGAPVRGLTGSVGFEAGCYRETSRVTLSYWRAQPGGGRGFDVAAVIGSDGALTPAAPAIVWPDGTLNAPPDAEELRGLVIRTLGAVQPPYMDVRRARRALLYIYREVCASLHLSRMLRAW